MRALWLPEVLRGAGLKVALQPGWEGRGREMSAVAGVICFTADAVILTRRGLITIDEVTTADEVWTHANRWRRVRSVSHRSTATHVVAGQGHPGLVTTAEHPFLAYDKARTRAGGLRRRDLGPTGWVPAIDLAGHYWCSPASFAAAGVPPIECAGQEQPRALSPELMWVLGYWLGNGSSVTTARRAQTVLYAPPRRGPMVEERVREAGLACSRRDVGSVHRICFSSKPLARWFHEHFGHLAHGKTLPAWALGMPEQWRRELLDGYLAADGGIVKPDGNRAARVDAVTVSKRLAIGVRLLAHSLGISTSLYIHHVPPTKQWGERTLNQRDWWTVRLTEQAPAQSHGRFVDGMFVAPCRTSADTGRVETVYNMAVEDDESYVVDGLIVHNCHHTAGPAKGNAPSLGIVTNGRSDLPGPLSQLVLGRDGTFYVVASGRANHAGRGKWRGVTDGNGRMIGIEAEATGRDAWPDVQMDAYRRGVAAILRRLGLAADACCAHKEWAHPKGRKPDPNFDMSAFRASVAAILSGHAHPKEKPMTDAERAEMNELRDRLRALTELVKAQAPLTVPGLEKPVVGIAATKTGQGYWEVSADGGVFAFGDARFLGSPSQEKLSHPVVGIVATPTDLGYWLVAADGGIFNYGDAPFLGTALKPA